MKTPTLIALSTAALLTACADGSDNRGAPTSLTVVPAAAPEGAPGEMRPLTLRVTLTERRAEPITVAGAPLQVDFEDERQFAQTAASKARVGAEVVDLELPVLDPEAAVPGAPLLLDGEGIASEVVVLNPTDAAVSGELQLFSAQGQREQMILR